MMLHRPVLIETYWNVNTVTGLALALGFTVLIETYWNVNYAIGGDTAGEGRS